MKKIIFISLLMILFAGYTKAQTTVYNDISLVTNSANYTVTASYDTTFVREVFINMNDTVGFQSLSVQLYEKTSNGWISINSANHTKPTVNNPCFLPLCFYLKNSNQWVLYLGAYSLNSRYRLELHFNSQFTNTTNTYWEQEF